MIPDADRITHMLEAIAKMRISLSGMTKDEFLRNDDKKAVAERYIMVVGEAAHMVSRTTRERFPQIPWQDANDMRNVVAHEYMQVDYDEVWNVATKDFPELEKQLLSIRSQIPPPV
ncbi:MAG: DUF86 domain-containing protein [Kiritimatiellae bacterium]|nr:DUF86 domain-containing protein [Kiritimatiellia bacterium]